MTQETDRTRAETWLRDHGHASFLDRAEFNSDVADLVAEFAAIRAEAKAEIAALREQLRGWALGEVAAAVNAKPWETE